MSYRGTGAGEKGMGAPRGGGGLGPLRGCGDWSNRGTEAGEEGTVATEEVGR